MSITKQVTRVKEIRILRSQREELLVAICAIMHRHQGVFDSPHLMKFGPLSTNAADDMAAIASLVYDRIVLQVRPQS